MIDPDPCGRITPTAALMPLTAPRTLTRKARSQSSVAMLWMRPFGDSTPALLIEHVEPAEALDRRGDHSPDRIHVAHVGQHRARPRPRLGEPGNSGLERGSAHVAQHEVGVGLGRQLPRDGRTEGATGADDRHGPSRRGHTRR